MAIAAVQAVGLLATAAIRRPRPLAPQDLGRPTVWGNMIDGLRYAKRDSLIMGALLMAAIANLTGFPFNMAVLPVFARNVLHTDSAGLGLMLSCIGIGSLAGSMVLAGIPNLRYAGRWMIAGMAGWHLAYLLVALSPSVPVAAVPLLAVGVMQSIAMVTIAAILLGRALPQYRGRVMGLRQLAVYTLVGGSPAAGAMAGAIGIPATAAALCGLGLTLILGLAWRVRGLASEHAARLPA
jgi:MFS family permease